MTDKEIFIIFWFSAISGFIIYYTYKCICDLKEKTKVETIP